MSENKEIGRKRDREIQEEIATKLTEVNDTLYRIEAILLNFEKTITKTIEEIKSFNFLNIHKED